MIGRREGAAIARLKTRVVTACRILAHERLVAAFGHVSVRVPGTARLIISPRAGPGTVIRSSLLVVDLQRQGRRGAISGAARPPLELPIHTAIYRARLDVETVCRIHGEAASVLSVLGIPVRPLHFLGSVLGGEVPVHDEGDLITDQARGDAMVRALRGHHALLLRGNGQIVVGATLAEACVRAIYLEEAARMQLQAMALGAARYYTTDEVAAYRRAWDDPVNIERVWDYYARRLTPS
ncbi:MAG: class II aldolase/adducin family protein [bacterium]